MALQKLTQIDGGGISTTSDYQVGVVTTRGIKGIGIFSGGSVVHSGVITALNFLGNGNSFAIGGEANGVVDINIAGDIDSGGTSRFTNINTLGIITASNAYFLNNVTIGGTLTYEDVTNIDSVGIITARHGLKVLAGGANVVGVVTATTFKGDGDFVDLDVDGHAEFDNVRIAGVTTTAAVNWGGHIIPTSNAVYDIGTAEKKVRHLFLSDNSLKFVDSSDTEHPLSVDSGRLKFGGGLLLGNTIKADSASGILTATSFSGDGSSLTGISADKIFEGNTKAEVSDSGSDGKFFVETEGTEKFSIDSTGNFKFNQCNDSYFDANGALTIDYKSQGSIVARNQYSSSYCNLILFQNNPLTIWNNNDAATTMEFHRGDRIQVGTGASISVTGNIVSAGIATFASVDINNGSIDGTNIGFNHRANANFNYVDIANDLDVTGNTELKGNVDLGNSGSDTITPNGRFDANILPHIDNNQYYKLGNSSYRWHTAHFGTGGIKIDGGGINVVGVVTATSFDGPSQIGIQSGGVQIGAGITQLNFVGTGNTFAVNGTTVDVSIAGGSGGGGGGSGVGEADSLGRVAFMHYGGFESNDSIKFPQKYHEIYSHVDAAVDIEDGVTVDIDLDCLLVITDKNAFDSFANELDKINYLGSNGFKDNARCVFDFDAELTALKKVGYVMIPIEYGNEISCDIEDGITVSVGDMCVLNIGQE
tara:strand:+ start:125 stop:2239 length:2115 start_codon:yes stop_codon:yes gene_type:complete